MTSDAAPSEQPAPSQRPRETFAVRLTFSGEVQEFESPYEAGRAFFHAEPAERPNVTHVVDNSARTMARTEIHGAHPDGQPQYFKSLPASYAPDVAFREGFIEALEQSIVERLGQFQLAGKGLSQPSHPDDRLHDDLEAFAYREPRKAAALWGGRGAELSPGPVLRQAVDAHGASIETSATTGTKSELISRRMREDGNANDLLTAQHMRDLEL